MAQNQSWVSNGQNFTFAGCSGATLVKMAGSGDDSQDRKITSPTMLTMMVGGNNAGFGAAVDNCIYHGIPGVDYGPPFDQDSAGTGKCHASLDFANDYVHNETTVGGKGLKIDIIKTLDDIMRDMAGQGTKEFTLCKLGSQRVWLS